MLLMDLIQISSTSATVSRTWCVFEGFDSFCPHVNFNQIQLHKKRTIYIYIYIYICLFVCSSCRLPELPWLDLAAEVCLGPSIHIEISAAVSETKQKRAALPKPPKKPRKTIFPAPVFPQISHKIFHDFSIFRNFPY